MEHLTLNTRMKLIASKHYAPFCMSTIKNNAETLPELPHQIQNSQ